MPIQESIDELLIELWGNDFRNIAFPPGWLFIAVVKEDPTELPRVAKNEHSLCLSQDKVVVLSRNNIYRIDPERSGHPQMDSVYIVSGELEEDAFAASKRIEKLFARKTTLQSTGVRAAEDSFPRMQLYTNNFGASTDVPLFAIPLDFGQLRHGAEYVRDNAAQR